MSEKTMTSEASAPGVPSPTKDPAEGCDAIRARIPDGEFYSCTDPETLNHDTPEGALEEYLDSWASKDCDMVALIRECSPVVLRAYKPMTISDRQIEIWAEDLLEKLGEMWGDEHCDPDQNPLDAFPDHADATMLAAVRSIIRGSRVWSCEACGSVTLSAEEVETLAREAFPYWFEEDPGSEEGP